MDRCAVSGFFLAACLFCACSRPREPLKSALPLASTSAPPVLLFNGEGTSPNDVTALDSSRLQVYRLLIFPGGNFLTIGSALTPIATARIRTAVQGGVNYLGICAGGFFAGRYLHEGVEKGLDLASGTRFRFYGIEGGKVRKAAVPIACGNGPVLEQYWEDGPQFTGWGTAVCTYPDGNPAIVEGASGKGWVV
ncbi:MAG TPA: BPL-N domain-containing protein [Fibrobacteria bacterium]|nr:BPL-N domain-containing protein [Fibrobacteria bacterium]